jgi:hypothetical protein
MAQDMDRAAAGAREEAWASARDPITGQTPVAPETGPEPRRGGWGVAARWLFLALVALIVVVVLYSMFGSPGEP